MEKLTKKLITAQLCMFIAGMQIFAEDRGAEFSIPSGFEASESPVEQQRSDAFQLLETLIELVDRTFGEQGSLLDQIRRRENRESSAALSFELFDLQKRTAKAASMSNRGLELIEAFSGVYGLSPAERSELQSIKNAIKVLQEEVRQNLELQERAVSSLQEIKARTSQLPMADLLREAPVPVELESMAHEVHRAEEVLKPLQKGLFDTYELLVDSVKELQGFLSRHAAKLPIEVRIKPELPVLPLPGGDSEPIMVDLATIEKLRQSKLGPEELSIPISEAALLPASLLLRGKVAPLPGEVPILPPKPSKPVLPARPVPELPAPPIPPRSVAPIPIAAPIVPEYQPKVPPEPAPALAEAPELPALVTQPLQPTPELTEVPERVTGEEVEESSEWLLAPQQSEEPADDEGSALAEAPELPALVTQPLQPAPELTEVPERVTGKEVEESSEWLLAPQQTEEPADEGAALAKAPELPALVTQPLQPAPELTEVPERVTGEEVEESSEWLLAPQQTEEPADEGPLEEQAPPAAAAEAEEGGGVVAWLAQPELTEEPSLPLEEEPAEEPGRAAEQQEPQIEEPEPAPAPELTEEPSLPSGEEPVEEPGRAAEQQEPQIEEPEGVVEEPARQALAAELGLPETAPAANLPRGLRALRAIMQKAPPEPAKLISPIEIEPKPAPRSGLRAMLPF